MGPCSQALRLSECPVSGVHTESNFMTVRQHEVCAKPEGSQSLPLPNTVSALEAAISALDE